MAQQMSMKQYWDTVGRPPAPGSPNSPLTQSVGGFWFGPNVTAQNNSDFAQLQQNPSTTEPVGSYSAQQPLTGALTANADQPVGGGLTQSLRGLYPDDLRRRRYPQ